MTGPEMRLAFDHEAERWVIEVHRPTSAQFDVLHSRLGYVLGTPSQSPGLSSETMLKDLEWAVSEEIPVSWGQRSGTLLIDLDPLHVPRASADRLERDTAARRKLLTDYDARPGRNEDVVQHLRNACAAAQRAVEVAARA